MKKLTSAVIAILLIACSAFVFADGGSIKFDQGNSVVTVKYKAKEYDDLKVIIKKGETKYYYNLYDDDETFPLQMGSGKYTVGVYKRISSGSNRYRSVLKSTQGLSLEKNKVYLQSVQNIDWSTKSKAIKLAKDLALGDVENKEAFKKVYDTIVKTIAYDHKKAATVNSRYLPVIDKTLNEEKGICYDYSSLMAGMLRSLNIPTKMVHGNASAVSEYHAWNEVLIGGEWITVDTTIDAQLNSWNAEYETEKQKEEYKTVKEF